MGSRRTQRACATIPSMLSSAHGAPELRPQAAADAEISAASAAATGSEAARPGDRGRRNTGGRVAEATTSLKGVAEGAECRGDSPTRKPDPEPGRMDHHQAGTGRYQVVSFCPQPRPPAPPGTPGLSPYPSAPRGFQSPFPPVIPGGACWVICFWLFWQDRASFTSLVLEPACGSFPLRPFFLDPCRLLGPYPSAVRYPPPPF